MRHESIICVVLALSLCSVVTRAGAREGAQERATKVIMAGAGNPVHVQTFMDELATYLNGAGVPVRQVDSGGQSRPGVVEKMGSLGAESLLWATVDIAVGQLKDKATLQCLDAQGKLLWEEEVSGGMFNASASGALKNMVKNMKKKLEKRIGGPGLPKQ
jgi:hypothetical protein